MVDVGCAPVVVVVCLFFRLCRGEVVEESSFGGQTGFDDALEIARLVVVDIGLCVAVTSLCDKARRVNDERA